MMRRIVTSLGRTAFRSRNFRVLRMSARDEPFGFGANTGQNIHDIHPKGQQNWASDANAKLHDFKKDNKLEQKQQGQSKAYQADTMKTDTLRAAGEGMTENKAEAFDKSANINKQNINRDDTNKTANTNIYGQNTAGTSPHDTFKPWEAKNQSSNVGMNKPAGQQGPGAFKSGAHQEDHMRATGSTNQWESKHVHSAQCGNGQTCAPEASSTSKHVHSEQCGYGEKCVDTGKQYESKNIGAKTCATDSAACRMEGGKCVTHTSQQTGKTTNFGAGSQNTQKTDQSFVDKAMGWVKEKLGSTTTGQESQQPGATAEIKQKNRATADSDKVFKDKKEYRGDQH